MITIEFVQSPRIVDDNYGGIAYIDLVDGREYTNVDAKLQDEPLDALMALERFPGKFPTAWQEICRQTEQEWKSEGECDNEEVLAAAQAVPNHRLAVSEAKVYHVTHRYRTDKPLDTCFKSDRPIQELKETVYYLIGIAAIMFEENLCEPLQEEELLSESICFLLQQYYDFELCPYQDGAVELDLYYLWEFDEDLQRTDPDWDLELHQKYGRAGVIDCIGMLMRGEIEVGIVEDCRLEIKGNHPKTALPESLIPTSNGDDFRAIQDYQSRSSDKQVSVDDYFDDSPDVHELEYSERIIESNRRQDEDQKKDLLGFVGAMEEHINKLPANERNDYADQLDQIKATDLLPELKDRVNQLSRDLYAKSYDTIQHDIAMFADISDGVASEQPENITQQVQGLDDTQGTKTPSVPVTQSTHNVFWITHKYSYLKSKLACVKTTRTLAQARLDAYYILSEGYGAFDENCELSDVEPMQESVCHLLVKFFGYEICEYDESAIEINLYDLWEWTHDDIRPTNKSWEMWLNLSRFRWGFYPELMAIMEGRLNVDRLPQYPWNSQHESVTGWDCGEYVIEVVFNLFNSKSEAEEFGRSCFALQTNEKYPNLFRLFYGDGDQACLRKSEVIVYRKPSDSSEVNPDDRATWEVTGLSAEDVPDLEISGPLYCQGREFKGGLHHAS